MIEFAISKSPDQDVVHNYALKKRKLTIGSGEKNSLIIDDDLMGEHHFTIMQTACSIIGKFSNDKYHSYLNEKLVTGIIVLKIGDIIRAGDTTLKITNFILRPLFNRQEFISDKCAEIFKSNSKQTALLSQIAEQISTLQNSGQ